MARRRGRRRGRGAAPILLGLSLGAVALAAFGAIGWVVFRESARPGLDATSLCPEGGPAGHLAVLLDTTDPVSATQLRAARARIEAMIDAAPDFTRVSFATVSPEAGPRADGIRSLCKPPADVSALTGNPRLVAARYRDAFLAPVEGHLEGLLAVPEADASPIMEALAGFLTAIPGFATDDVPHRVVLVTDLVQHSDTFSFYRGGDWSSFEADGGTARLGYALDGAEVEVLRLPRAAVPQTVVDDFWVRYFDAQGVTRVRTATLGDL